jgi:two-component system, LytTR family, response regulator
MRVLIVDDERGARVNVRHLLREYGLTDCLEADGGERAARSIVEDRPELLFLDVDMPEVDGFEVIRRVGPERMPEVVFLTAYDSFAVRAFEVNAVDYLLKPVSDERFGTALRRALHRLSEAEGASRRQKLEALLGGSSGGERPETFVRLEDAKGAVEGYLLREGRRNTVLRPEEILWLSAEDYCTSVHTAQGTHLVRATLGSVLSQLDGSRFMRVHRSAAVDCTRVRSAQRTGTGRLVLTLENGQRVPVSRRLAQALRLPRGI